MLARLHGANALIGVEPRLGDDDEGVEIGAEDVVQGAVEIRRPQLGAPALLLREWRHALRLTVAERDAVNERMAHEHVGEDASELSQADKTDTDSHSQRSLL